VTKAFWDGRTAGYRSRLRKNQFMAVDGASKKKKELLHAGDENPVYTLWEAYPLGMIGARRHRGQVKMAAEGKGERVSGPFQKNVLKDGIEFGSCYSANAIPCEKGPPWGKGRNVPAGAGADVLLGRGGKTWWPGKTG